MQNIFSLRARSHLATTMCFFMSSCTNSYIDDNATISDDMVRTSKICVVVVKCERAHRPPLHNLNQKLVNPSQMSEFFIFLQDSVHLENSIYWSSVPDSTSDQPSRNSPPACSGILPEWTGSNGPSVISLGVPIKAKRRP